MMMENTRDLVLKNVVYENSTNVKLCAIAQSFLFRILIFDELWSQGANT